MECPQWVTFYTSRLEPVTVECAQINSQCHVAHHADTKWHRQVYGTGAAPLL